MKLLLLVLPLLGCVGEIGSVPAASNTEDAAFDSAARGARPDTGPRGDGGAQASDAGPPPTDAGTPLPDAAEPPDSGDASPNLPSEVVFSNLGPADPVCSPCNYYDTGAHRPEPPYRRGMPFVVPADADFLLESVELSSFVALGSTATYLVSVNADLAGLPGAVLESFSFTSIGIDFMHPTLLLGASSLHPRLIRGQTYWLTTDVSDRDAMNVGWPENSQGSTGRPAWATTERPWNNPWGDAPQVLGAFRVQGARLQ